MSAERSPERSENPLKSVVLVVSLSVVVALAVLGGCNACEALDATGFGQEPRPRNTPDTYKVSQLPPVLTYQHSNGNWEILLEPDTLGGTITT